MSSSGLSAVVSVAMATLAYAQTSAPVPAVPSAPAPANSGWITRCYSSGRQDAIECAADKSVVVVRTGQVAVIVSFRFPGAGTDSPYLVVQLPHGVFFPTGVKAQVDDGPIDSLVLQSCDQQGCLVQEVISTDLMTRLRTGSQFKVSFQNRNKESVTLPIPLVGFDVALSKVR